MKIFVSEDTPHKVHSSPQNRTILPRDSLEHAISPAENLKPRLANAEKEKGRRSHPLVGNQLET